MRFFEETISTAAVLTLFEQKFGYEPYSGSGGVLYPDRNTYIQASGAGSATLENYSGTMCYTFRNLGDGPALEKFSNLFDAIKAKLCKEPPEGFIKSFISGKSELFWIVRRPTSSKTIEYNGKYYEAASGMFLKVYTSVDRATFQMRPQDGDNMDITAIHRSDDEGPEFFLQSILTPIYSRQDDGTVTERIVSYMLPHQAEEQYITGTLNGQTVFINKKRPEAAYWAKDVMNYSTRIETVVPESHLFQKGQSDLYKGRPKDITPFLGWELEAVGASTNARRFKELMTFDLICKADSSIQPSGFEVVSVPATLDFWKESNLSLTLDTLRSAPHDMRSFKHSSCGFHVHVSRAALSVLDLNKIERFVHNPANLEFMTSIAGRGPNTYQNYYPDMFDKRKDLGASSTRPRYSGGADPNRVSVSSLNNYIDDYGNNRDKATVHYIWDYISVPSGEVWDAMYAAIIGRGDFAAAVALLKQHHTQLGDVSPNVKLVLKHMYPDFFADTAQGDSSKWANFKALAKSSAPYNRKDSSAAAKIVKGPVGKSAKGRYDVLNTKNENTVEFRLFKGTMNPDSVFRYLEFVDAIVRYAHEAGAGNGALNQTAFCQWLVADTFNIARYEKLVAYLVSKQFIDRKAIRRRELNYNFEEASNG